jgi:hypothetical protein
MPSGRDSFRRNRVAPLETSILPSAANGGQIPGFKMKKTPFYFGSFIPGTRGRNVS